jgi:hypothetical protein
LSNPPDFKDPFSEGEAPPEGPNMWSVGNEGKTPSDILNLLLGGEFQDVIAVIMRTNFTAEECMVIVRTLHRAKFGLGLVIKDEKDKKWAMPWLRDAVIHLAMARMSTDFHSVNTVKEALQSMRTKQEQTIKMSNL